MTSRTRLLIPLALVLLLVLGALLLSLVEAPAPSPARDAPEAPVQPETEEDRARVRVEESVDRAASEAPAAPPVEEPDDTHALEVTVLDATGAPAVGARVRIVDRMSTSNIELPDSMWLAEGLTGDGGCCRVRIPKGHMFKVVADREGQAGVVGNLNVRDEELFRVEVRLRDAPAIRGRVVTEDGVPVPGIRVGGWFRTPPLSQWTHVVTATTDAGGRFTFVDVPDDHHGRVVEIRALRAPGYWPAVRNIPPEELDREIVVEVLRTTQIRGRFVVRNGGPVTSGSLQVSAESWTFDVTVDGKGAFDAELPRGRLRLRLYTPDALPWNPPGTVDGTGALTRLGTIELDPGAVVTGRVVDGRGGPVLDAVVSCGGQHATTDEDGRFRLDHLSVMAQKVVARAPTGSEGRIAGDWAEVSLTPPANDVRLRLSDAGMIDLHFEVPEGKSVPGRVHVKLYRDGVPVQAAWLPGRGLRVRLRGPGPGTYSLRVDAEPYARVEIADLEISSAASTVRTIALRRAQK